MKKLLFFTTAFVVSLSVYGQNQSPTLLASAGGINQSESIELEWSLGETFVETYIYSNKMLTSGFHQPFLRSNPNTLNTTNIRHSPYFTAIPNPSNDILNIRVNNDEQSLFQGVLCDMSGKKILETPSLKPNETVRINVRDIPAGMYFLFIRDIEGNYLESKKIVIQD
jgi:hypothetical protein